jgi:hypothetical protein
LFGRIEVNLKYVAACVLAIAMEMKAMFSSLEEQIENTEGKRPRTLDSVVRYAGIVILSVIVFGGLCAVIIALE